MQQWKLNRYLIESIIKSKTNAKRPSAYALNDTTWLASHHATTYPLMLAPFGRQKLGNLPPLHSKVQDLIDK